MEIQIKEFLFTFRKMTNKEKIDVISSMKASHLKKVKDFCCSEEFFEINSEIDIILENIGFNLEEECEKEFLESYIFDNKRAIMLSLENENFEEEYSFTEEQVKKIDDFFEKTYRRVISDLLSSMDNKMTNSGWKRNRKSHFTVSSLAVIFPDDCHDRRTINYLEDKYQDKFNEFGLDEIGITSFSLNPSQRRKEDPFFEIDYSYKDIVPRKSKYLIYSYDLSITCDLIKRKVYKKNV